MSQRLYVGNLAFSTDEQAVEALFAEAGPVRTVNLIRDRETGRSRGFAFVEMESDEGARAAIERFHDHEFEGRRLTVNEARPREDRPSGGGGGNRRPRGGSGGGGNRDRGDRDRY